MEQAAETGLTPRPTTRVCLSPPNPNSLPRAAGTQAQQHSVSGTEPS